MAISKPNAAKYFRKYSTGCIMNILTVHKSAKSMAKKKGVTLPLSDNAF
tara:strand:+ start:117 stop:263 length:147 start_codon:yes stop_codon:yes gene_type:complete